MALSANSAAFVFAHPERNIVLGCNKASLRKTHSLRETINMFIELDSKTSEKPPKTNTKEAGSASRKLFS